MVIGENSVAIFLMRGIDLGVIAVTIAVFWFIHSRGLLESRHQTNVGRWMIFFGLCLLIGQSIVELMFKSADPNVPYFQNPVFLPEHVPTSLHWLMTRGAYLLLVFGALFALLERRSADKMFGADQKRLIRAAQSSVMQLEERFRNLLDTTQYPVYCWSYAEPVPLPASVEDILERSRSAVLVECNDYFVKILKKDSMAEAIGTPVTQLGNSFRGEAHRQMIQAFWESEFSLKDYELSFTGSDGKTRALNVSLTGIIENDQLVRVWGSQSDLRKIREAESALRRRRNFQDLVAGISSYMIMTPIERSRDIVEHCLKEVCGFIGADSSSLVWINWQEENAEIRYRWSNRAGSLPASVGESDFPKISKTVRAGRVVRIADVRDMPKSAEADQKLLQSWGMRSFVSLPMVIAGDHVGVVNFSSMDKVRDWSDQDILDLRVIAELFANFVSRLRSHSDLALALDELSEAKERLEAENVYLREEIQLSHGFDEIVGDSDAILRTLRMVEMVAETDTPVLILGETGTGKELIARAIHQRSRRSERSLVKVNCATLPANLIESELFGYEKGAFTGADQAKRGRFDLADGSTLFLDEFGELPLELQTKLLRVLQEGEFDRLGGTQTIKVDVRLIVATNRDLAESVRAGAFRSDLFYRVNTFPISIPPLRERDGDIEKLAQHFLNMYAKRMGREFRGISSSMMQQLREYDWPGNVRELEGVIQRAVISSNGEVLDLPDPLVVMEEERASTKVVSTTIADLKLVERDHILSVLEETSWRISGPNGAATKLGLPPSTLRSKMKKLDIVKPH